MAFFDKDRMEKVTKRVKKVPSIVQMMLGDEANEKLMNLFTEEEQSEIKEELSLLPKI